MAWRNTTHLWMFASFMQHVYKWWLHRLRYPHTASNFDFDWFHKIGCYPGVTADERKLFSIMWDEWFRQIYFIWCPFRLCRCCMRVCIDNAWISFSFIAFCHIEGCTWHFVTGFVSNLVYGLPSICIHTSFWEIPFFGNLNFCLFFFKRIYLKDYFITAMFLNSQYEVRD